MIQDISFIFAVARDLWNTLLEPVGAKVIKRNNTFHCPTPERPYLSTMLNSK